MPFDLLSVLEIRDATECKFHAARWNTIEQPLDAFTRDRNVWRDWNCWRGDRDDFNRRYVVSFIHFYVEARTWLIGGMFEVLERGAPREHSYVLRDCERGRDLVGRLKIRADISRGRSFRLENIECTISEVLPEPYTGEPFTSVDNVSLDFSMLEAIVRNDRLDWKTALQNVKGIYVIVDRRTGRKHVGSASGDVGIWSRWCAYVATGHGGNIGLVELLRSDGIAYARENFRLTLLETWPTRTGDDVVLARESYWKDALLTRGDFGYNNN